ncbi:helix-turn-helix domain-containing protein [Tautonia rosea]|uniref:helix-turn-helix domain-containing protein n=1 Tax=Tautonia rosea TaxID=2728037 RepID=UPI0014733A2B|nr:helix-turn-helix domain-containing protein [Tautonia rosea]
MHSLCSQDFDELAASFEKWNSRFDQLDAGTFSGRITFANLEGFQLFDVEVNRRISAQGSIPEESFVISPVLDWNVGAIWRGRTHRQGTLHVLGPGEVMDHRTPANYRNTSLVVSADLLHRTASMLGFEEVLPRLDVRFGLRVSARDCAALHREIVTSLQRLSTEHRGPVPTSSDPDVVVRTLRRLLLVASGGRDLGPPPQRWSKRKQVVRQVEDFMRAHLDRPISVLDLCEQVGVSERTLHYAFREFTGVTPKGYLKTLRLNQLRRDLGSADPRRETVRQVAARWGFGHPGELAADYRRHFGQLPSQRLGTV